MQIMRMTFAFSKNIENSSVLKIFFLWHCMHNDFDFSWWQIDFGSSNSMYNERIDLSIGTNLEKHSSNKLRHHIQKFLLVHAIFFWNLNFRTVTTSVSTTCNINICTNKNDKTAHEQHVLLPSNSNWNLFDSSQLYIFIF